MSPTVAIIGRPNVGKSTLFNRLVGRRRALVDDTPGVTRDRLEGRARLFDLEFRLLDTAGLEPDGRDDLARRLARQSLKALEEADVGLFLVDARTGLTPLDEEIADLLRRQRKPVVLAANKCEGRAAEAQALEACALGLGEPVRLSAEHGLGLDELADALRPHLAEARDVAPPPERDGEGRIRLAVVGRPNTGKSSLVNRLLGEERLLTGPEPGLTRDAVDLDWSWRGREFTLVDTAGLRRRARIDHRLERASASATVRAIERADVVVLMVDATAALEKQDTTIANLALERGRALVIAANKWDLVEDPRACLAEIRHRVTHRLGQIGDVPVVTLSVLTGRNLDRLMATVCAVFDRWSRRIATGRLNRWLAEAVARHPPPTTGGRRSKIRYATQVGTRPPQILLFGNRPAQELPASYRRYLLSDLKSRFDLAGVPVRLAFRVGDNPYAPGATARTEARPHTG